MSYEAKFKLGLLVLFFTPWVGSGLVFAYTKWNERKR